MARCGCRGGQRATLAPTRQASGEGGSGCSSPTSRSAGRCSPRWSRSCCAIVGIVAFFSLSVREYPDIDPPIVSVETSYTGAAAQRGREPHHPAARGAARRHRGHPDDHLALARRPLGHLDRVQPRPRRRRGRERRARPRRRRGRRSARRRAAARGPQGRCRRAADHVLRHLAPRLVAAPAQRLCRPQHLVDRFSSIDGVARVFSRRRGAAVDARLARARAARRVPADARAMSRPRCAPRMSSFPPAASNGRTRMSTLRVNRPFATPAQFAQLDRRPRRRRLSRPAGRRRAGRGGRRRTPIRRSALNGDQASASASSASRAPTRSRWRTPRRRRAREIEPNLPQGMTIVVGSRQFAVHQQGDREGLADAGRGGGARRARHLPVPRKLARDADPGGHRADLPARHLRRAVARSAIRSTC